ncbi:hypothetical protein CAEBREN_31103 [Caenorhabditis brenneri]|uniref:Uncharacterized protein n=1 Tax=Caenorhabditis brenneri TaxID=135651 RepID=G0P021_CAEBE|nr:hypothetical protein CAEBREN_31103 [Caenorhabditis brenneri]
MERERVMIYSYFSLLLFGGSRSLVLPFFKYQLQEDENQSPKQMEFSSGDF